MNSLCIRVTYSGFTDPSVVSQYLRSISDRGFICDHDTENRHFHAYIETAKKEQQVRTQISKMRTGGNRTYSVSQLREELHKYISYVMYKPESGHPLIWGDFPEQEYAKRYSELQTKQKEKKAVNWFEDVRQNCYYDVAATTEDNFNTLYDYLIDRSYVNQFTLGRIQSMFYVWRAQAQKSQDVENYKKNRADIFRKIIS